MTYTFKLARRLARLRSGALLASFLTLACADGNSPNAPESGPIPNDPSAIDVYPDTASVKVDGTVQFDAQEAPLSEDAADYHRWGWKRKIVSVTVDPDSVKLAPGASRKFSATGKTSYGSDVGLELQWKATGGTVSDSGTYVAGKTPGNYIVVATTSSGLADTAKVVVNATSGGTTTRQVVLTPASVTLSRGEQQQFSAAGKVSDGSSFTVDPSYRATGGTVSNDGMYTAGQTLGTYRVIAVDYGTGLADTASVTIVNDDGAIASVTVSPASTSLTVGQTKQLSATIKDGLGNVVAGATASWNSSNDGVATVSSSGMVTAIGAGNATITASSGGKQGDAAVSVASPAPEPPPTSGGGSVAACENLPAATRTVNATPSTLASALSGALPGDRIVLAPGTYAGRSWSNRDGTQARPIVLCGPRTAILQNLRPDGIDWWIFQGFTIRNAFQAFYARRTTHTRLQGVEIYNVDQEAVHFLCNSTDNVIQGNHIHDTGLTKPSSGEAVYLGTWAPSYEERCGTSATDRSDRNQILNNRFGPNVPSEDVDAKEGTSGGVIRGNVSDGRGKRAISGHFEASIAIKGSTSGYVVEDNTLNPAAQNGSALGNGIYVYSGGSGHQIRGNAIDMTGAGGYGIKMNGSGTISCDNSVTDGRLSNVGCR